MNVWIQRHDFSSKDLDDTTIESALNQLATTDWAGEAKRDSEKQDAGEESCPAGIGFVHPSGTILHLCPNGTEQMMVHYHYPATKHILGLFRISRDAVLTLDSVPAPEAESLIRLHYSNNSGAILELAKRIEGGDRKPDHVPS